MPKLNSNQRVIRRIKLINKLLDFALKENQKEKQMFLKIKKEIKCIERNLK